jgi:predicted nucleic acid-binding protein
MDCADQLTEQRLKVVLGDANVLYARVLRDYLLYSASEGIISIVWSDTILDEMVEHLTENVAGFDAEAGAVLKQLMNEAYPLAQIEASPEEYKRIGDASLPDEGDRHVLAAAVAADADILCTANIKDFPEIVTRQLGLRVLTPDSLLCILIEKHPSEMQSVHAKTIARLRGATSDSTIEALRLAGAKKAAMLMEHKEEAYQTRAALRHSHPQDKTGA